MTIELLTAADSLQKIFGPFRFIDSSIAKMMVKNGLSAIATVVTLMVAIAAARSPNPGNGTVVCQTVDCWRTSNWLHASLNTTASPCQDFEEFLCGGFRTSHQFTGDSLLLSGRAYMDYMDQRGVAYTERVTEQLATGCWEANCTGQWSAASPKLRAYELTAIEALRDCVRIESSGNKSLHELMRLNVMEIIEEAIDFGVDGVGTSANGNLRIESLLPVQSRKSLLTPLMALPDLASRQGRPALALISADPFLQLEYLPTLFAHFPMQASRLMRRLQLQMPRSLFGLMRYTQASVQLWDHACNKTAAVAMAAAGGRPLRTVADVKRLLRSLNLTFDLGEYLRLSAEPYLTVNDTTDVVLPNARAFIHTVCLLEHCSVRRPDLLKVLVMNQIASLAVKVIYIAHDARCIEELFGLGGGGEGTRTAHVGAFRPLLHGRYARDHVARSATVEAEARAIFGQLKAEFTASMTTSDWIPDRMKRALASQLQTTELKFQRASVSEASLLRLYSGVMNRMPARGCVMSASPACLLVRVRALQMSLTLSASHYGLDSASPHYAQMQHSVLLTPAFTEPPHYLSGQPSAFRLGSLGFVLAHELVHGLVADTEQEDLAERATDSDEDQLPSSWSEELTGRFRSRADCLRRRLAAGHGLNKTSVAEDVADQIGMSATRRALMRGGDGTERLPGYMARFTPEQLLYLASMRIFCSKSVPGFWRSFMPVSAHMSHTPGRMRIQSMLSGDADFAKTFGCLVGTGSEHASGREKLKCEFW